MENEIINTKTEKWAKKSRVPFIILMVLGAVILVAGIFFSVILMARVVKHIDDVERLARFFEGDGAIFVTISSLLDLVGGASLAVGIVFFVIISNNRKKYNNLVGKPR